MSHPYDATTKFLIEEQGSAYLQFFPAHQHGPVTPIPADVSTVTAASDKVLFVDAPTPWFLHLEIQSSRDTTIRPRSLVYNILLCYRHEELPVRTLVVLLRREANHESLNGAIHIGFEDDPILDFCYRVLRVWEQPLARLLEGNIGIAPLAPLCDEAETQLVRVVERLGERFATAPPAVAKELWTATDVLMGLRYERNLVEHLLRGVQGMHESVTYRAIFEEGERQGELRGERQGELRGELRGKRQGKLQGERTGERKGIRQILLRIGGQRFGPADATVTSSIQRIKSLERLNRMAEQLMAVATWQELLAVE